MNVLVGPIHFRYVNKTFNTVGNFNKAAVFSEICNLTFNLFTNWEAFSNVLPWIFAKLFQA